MSARILSRALLTKRLTLFTVPRCSRSISATTRFQQDKMQAVKNTIAENMGLGGVAHSMAPADSQFDILKDVPDQSGKVAVITGGSQGIGYAAAFILLKNNLEKLFILSVEQDTFNGAIKDITDKLGAEVAQKVTWIQCDLGHVPNAAKAAKEIASKTDRIDILVMNAARGIMTYQETEDSNIDRHMMVNHVAHVTLCSHLLPILKKTSEQHTVRIQVQSSNAHEMTPSDTKFESIDELNQDLGPNPLYGRSKLAVLLYARYLDRHLHKSHPNILINATHPGFVETKMSVVEIHEPYPILGYGMSLLMSPLKKDQWEGSTSALYAVTKTNNSGEYICPPAIVEPGSDKARDAQLGEQLMKLTREIVKTKYASSSVDKGCPLTDY